MQNYIKCKGHVNKIRKENLEFHENLIKTFGTIELQIGIQFQIIEFPKGIKLQMLVI
jgi:hypothetical protein